MINLLTFGTSVLHFGEYLVLSVSLSAAFLAAYTYITPHDEFCLIRKGDTAATIGLMGALIGFVLPLASVVSHSDTLIDVTLWGLVALLVQLGGFFTASKLVKGLSTRIEEDQLSAGIFSAGISIALGLLNAACLVP